MPNVGLIEHAVIVLMYLVETIQNVLNMIAYNVMCTHVYVLYSIFLTSPVCEQCSSIFLLPFTCDPAASRASFAEVKESLGFGVSSSFLAFLPPALAAAAAADRLFGGMMLAENPAEKVAMLVSGHDAWTSSDMPTVSSLSSVAAHKNKLIHHTCTY